MIMPDADDGVEEPFELHADEAGSVVLRCIIMRCQD